MTTYVFADIAGQYDALMRLINKLENPTALIFVGDLVDRGPKSKEVVEFCMSDPRVISLRSNHDDMLIDYCRREGRYDRGIWQRNGGTATMESYGGVIPDSHVEWLATRPLAHVVEGGGKKFHIQHTFKMNPELPRWEEEPAELWNREYPVEIPGEIQISGHNSHWRLRAFKNAIGEVYALGIDDSSRKRLTAVALPDITIIQEPYDLQ